MTEEERQKLERRAELYREGLARAALTSYYGVSLAYSWFKADLVLYTPGSREYALIKSNLKTARKIFERLKETKDKEERRARLRRAGVLLDELLNLDKQEGQEMLLDNIRQEYGWIGRKARMYERTLKNNGLNPKAERLISELISYLKRIYGEDFMFKGRTMQKRYAKWKEARQELVSIESERLGSHRHKTTERKVSVDVEGQDRKLLKLP
jgi:hypothetical protein